jgi:hypothetical protein
LFFYAWDCRQKYCRKLFIAKIKKVPNINEITEVEIVTNDIDSMHGRFPIANNCSGNKRVLTKKVLEKKPAFQFRKEMVKETNIEGL